MATWRELMEMFNLEDEVEQFVIKRVKELTAKERHDFRFRGGNHTFICDMEHPHIPHVIDHYHTVRYGSLEHFCLGKEGETPEGKLVIVVEDFWRGSPESPGYAKGYWFIEKNHKKEEV